jgi:hypothetical protein
MERSTSGPGWVVHCSVDHSDIPVLAFMRNKCCQRESQHEGISRKVDLRGVVDHSSFKGWRPLLCPFLLHHAFFLFFW